MVPVLIVLTLFFAILLAATWWDRHRAEKRFALYRDVFEKLDVGIKVWRLENPGDPGSLRLMASNQAAAQATGVPVAEVLGKTIAEGFPEAVPRGIAGQFAEVAQTGKSKDMGEVVYSDARMREGVYSVFAFPLPGRCVGVAFENVTKRKLAEMAVQRNTSFVELVKSVAVAANQALSTEDAFQTALDSVCRHTGWPVGHVYLRSAKGSALVSSKIWCLADTAKLAKFRALTDGMTLSAGEGLAGRVLASGKFATITDTTLDAELVRADEARACGLMAGFAFPVSVAGEVEAILEFFSADTMMPDASLLKVMEEVGSQLARVVERQRAGDTSLAARRQVP